MSLRASVQPGTSKRTDFPLIPSKACLLIIDVQKYVTPEEEEDDGSSGSGSFYQQSTTTMCHNIPRLLEAFRKHRDSDDKTKKGGCEVIFTYLQSLTQDRRDISLDYKLSGPELSGIPPPSASLHDLFLKSIMPQLGEDILVPKTSCSVFMSTNIEYVLRNLQIEQLVVCGQLTDQCVESAVRDAADLGYFVTCVQDACAAKSIQAKEKGQKGMSGFCRFCSTDEILEELSAASTSAIIGVGDESNPNNPLSPTKASSSTPPLSSSLPVITTATNLGDRIQQQRAASFSPEKEMEAYTRALLYALQASGVQFLRYLMIDVCNTVRCKMAPLDHLLIRGDLRNQIALAKVVTAGLPSFADGVLDGTGLDAASGAVILQPELNTLRILPYAPQSALVLGTLQDGGSDGNVSKVCTRGLLQKVVTTAREEFGIEFSVGAELEFCLHDASTGKPADLSTFCNTTTLNQRQAFLQDVYNHLKQQRIPVEAIHAESAPGQLEVVLHYQTDPVKLADLVILAQETIRAASHKHALKALFLPKIHPTEAGNGLHLHLSFHSVVGEGGKEDQPMSERGAASSSTDGVGFRTGRGQSFLEGILDHLGALLGLTMPTANSFRRMAPGCWTGSTAEWGVEDKEAALRVCSSFIRNDSDYHSDWQHVEYKLNDGSANIYLSLAGILTCGLEGIECRKKLRPSRCDNQDRGIQGTALPESIEQSLDQLEGDSLLMALMGPTLSQSYLALRQAEAKRASTMTLADEVEEALTRA